MTTSTIDKATSQALNASTELADTELAAATGGYHCPTQNSDPITNPVDFARDYWGHCGWGTFGDFWFQLTN